MYCARHEVELGQLHLYAVDHRRSEVPRGHSRRCALENRLNDAALDAGRRHYRDVRPRPAQHKMGSPLITDREGASLAVATCPPSQVAESLAGQVREPTLRTAPGSYRQAARSSRCDTAQPASSAKSEPASLERSKPARSSGMRVRSGCCCRCVRRPQLAACGESLVAADKDESHRNRGPRHRLPVYRGRDFDTGRGLVEQDRTAHPGTQLAGVVGPRGRCLHRLQPRIPHDPAQ